MAQESFIVGNREFVCHDLPAFECNRLILRLQKVLVPIIGGLSGKGDLMDMDAKSAAAVIAENLDESILETILLPMFAGSKLCETGTRRFIRTAADIDLLFTRENLFDLYELAWLVGRYQFGPFISSAMSRFGAQAGATSK